MAEYRLIDAYLAELRHRLRRLPRVDDLVAEANDHLLSATERLVLTGVPPAEAERTALARYGSARRVARAFRDEADRRGAVATEHTRKAGRWAVVSAVTGALSMLITRTDVLLAPAALLNLVALVTFIGAVAGIRARHGRLGIWGRLAWRTFLASVPVGIALGVTFKTDAVLVVLLSASICLLGVGLLRARILPAGAVGLVTFAWVVAVIGLPESLAMTVCFSLGFGWIGWSLATEPALAETIDSRDVAA